MDGSIAFGEECAGRRGGRMAVARGLQLASSLRSAMGVALALVVLIAASLLFHFLSPFWVTGVVFVVVNLFMAYAIYRYRHRANQRAQYEPENKKLEWWLLAVTTVGVAAMLTPGLFVWAKFVNVPADALDVEVVAQQWNWAYRFPGKDGKLGRVSAGHVSGSNPFGLDPKDPAGQDDILVDNGEVRLPLGKPVRLLLRSKDVLHNFAIAEIRIKMDMVPGMVTHAWFTPTRTGSFDLLCQELCGIAHFAMRGRMVVEEPAGFDAWMAKQPTFAQLAARPAPDPAAGKALYAVCAGCHGEQGEGMQAANAPKLSGQDPWYLRRQLVHFKQGARGSDQRDANGKIMAQMTATLPDAAAIDDVVAYIGTLPDKPAATTVSGNAAKGRARYTTCGACHGAKGEGAQATNAPRLRGMSDWYMVGQLTHFRDGVRGGHKDDLYGAQMVQMVGMLADEQSIRDVVAYLNGL
jgi:cytochrome c oxidase subunit 2